MSLTNRLAMYGAVAALMLFGCNNRNATQAAAAPAAPARPAPEATSARSRLNPLRLLQRFDQNGSGTLELTELPALLQGRLRSADSNNDGTLSGDELAASRAALRTALFSRMDTNNDGAVTAEEVGQRWDRLSLADADRDGRVVRAEFEQALGSGALFGRVGTPAAQPTAPAAEATPQPVPPVEQPAEQPVAAEPVPAAEPAVAAPAAVPAAAEVPSTEELEAAQ